MYSGPAEDAFGIWHICHVAWWESGGNKRRADTACKQLWLPLRTQIYAQWLRDPRQAIEQKKK